MSTITPTKPEAKQQASSTPKAPKRQPRKRAAKPKGTTAAKRRKSTSEQDTLAAMANAKAKPAARISGANIVRVQRKLGGKKPSEYLGISANRIAEMAAGKKTKGDLKPDQRGTFGALSAELGSSTFYGRKLAGMLWAIEKGVKPSN